MTYLLDTNVFLEFLLEQENADEASELLEKLSAGFGISLFALYSIGIILTRRGSASAFLQLVEDIEETGTVVVQLHLSDMSDVITAMQQHSLDFDDAYQYTVAEKYDLTIVSCDRDFDRTSRGRTTPGILLRELERQNDENQDNDTK
ncbi:MAG: type II toxin-antitoxin system VapC family toxin [Chloroflexi bacterium]|nr:type II toxin-antitoxin system VapC family toxin [Chloroflexota bacterium]